MQAVQWSLSTFELTRLLPTFAQLVLAHAPPQSIEKNTLPVLQITAEGNPPSVWGAPRDSGYIH